MMIQDIAPHRFDNAYTPASPQPDDFVVCYKDGRISAVTGKETRMLKVSDFENEEFRFLFRIDGKNVFGLINSENLPRDAEYIGIRRAMSLQPQHISYTLLCAFHILKWYDEQKFCPKCGRKMNHSDRERAMICPDCGMTKYPVISPCVIVAILDGERLLLTKYAGRGYSHYRLVAGFTEFGETAEETCIRETFEETGLHIKNLKYYKCQPWAMSQSLLFGFYAQLDGSDEVTVDENELRCAEWKSVYEVGNDTLAPSLTREMIREAKNHLYK